MVASLTRHIARAVTKITAMAIALGVGTTAASANEYEFPFEAFQKNSEDTVITPLGEADPAFREIFDNWSGSAKSAKAAGVTVSIPSLKPVRDYRLTSNFGYRSDPFRGSRRRHNGLDMAGPVGTPIYATADGIVGRAQWVGGYGKYIEINHGNEIQTRYGHMSRLNVSANQRVKAGDLIGYMGSTGRSTGSHLHYEVRIAGEPVDPRPFMQGSDDFLLAQLDRAEDAQGGPEED